MAKIASVLLLLVLALGSVLPTAAHPKRRQQNSELCCPQVDVDGCILAADIPKTWNPEIVVGKAIRRLQPGYPVLAMAGGVTGTIVVIASVSDSGEVLAAEIRFGGDPNLEAASIEAAKGWRFTPTTLAGKRVPAFAQIVFRFHRVWLRLSRGHPTSACNGARAAELD